MLALLPNTLSFLLSCRRQNLLISLAALRWKFGRLGLCRSLRSLTAMVRCKLRVNSSLLKVQEIHRILRRNIIPCLLAYRRKVVLFPGFISEICLLMSTWVLLLSLTVQSVSLMNRMRKVSLVKVCWKFRDCLPLLLVSHFCASAEMKRLLGCELGLFIWKCAKLPSGFRWWKCTCGKWVWDLAIAIRSQVSKPQTKLVV